MAVNKNRDTNQDTNAVQYTQRSNWLVGLNVVLMVALSVALVAGLQWLGMTRLGRVDITASGINSLTAPTEALLKGIDQKVTLTSLYFKTDIENKDQDRYRSTVDDLLELYRVSNRSKIEFESINPLQDHEKRSALLTRLANRKLYKEQAAGHVKAVNRFQEEFAERITELLGEDLAQIQTFGELSGNAAQLTNEVKEMFVRLGRDVRTADQQIKDALASEVPAYSVATSRLRKSYSDISRSLENIVIVGAQYTQKPDEFPPPVQQFFVDASSRYNALIGDLKTENETISQLPVLDLDQIIRELAGPKPNPILIETEDQAVVISFQEIWPPIDGQSLDASFEERSFQGEQMLTSAILKLTQTTTTAVVFVRHGGSPLIASANAMNRQPAGPFARMRAQLENVNFRIYEWDLATSSEPPAIDSEALRTIFVVDRPTPPRPNPLQQGPQDLEFTPDKLDVLKRALGDSPRAIFLGGFLPDATGAPAPYEFKDYLETDWGILTDNNRVLLFIEPVAPGKYRFVRFPLNMFGASFSDHPISASLSAMQAMFPLVAPTSISETPPENVKHHRLAWMDRSDSIWNVSDAQYYFDQQTEEFIVPADGDYQGEFMFGVAAEKDESKVVLINSTQFATDRFAQEQQRVITPHGLDAIPINPGNATLFINALHWLNDNVAMMNLGSPIDYSTLNIKKGATSTLAVQVFATAVWPLLAAVCGLGVYFARRR